MPLLLLLTFGAPVAGIVLAVTWWATRGASRGLTEGSARTATVAVGVIGVSAIFVGRLVALPFLMPFPLPAWVGGAVGDGRFIGPLIAGTVLVAVLTVPVVRRSGSGVADLMPRGPFSFTRGWWFIPSGALVLLLAIVTLWAGSASTPDPETGRHTMFIVEISGENTMGTTIYGWYYSVPSLVAALILASIATVVLYLIARPPLASDRTEDVRIRTIRSRNVVAIVTGALALQLAPVFTSLAGTASLQASFPADLGPVWFGTPFAALVPLFTGAALVMSAIGTALWASVTLSAIPARHPVAMATGSGST